MIEPTPDVPARIECRVDEGFAAWLAGMNGTIALTTYQAGKVVLIGWDGRQVTLLARDFDKPMGLAVDGPRLLLATRNEVILLADAPALARDFRPEEPGRYDALYLPRARYCTGDLNVHDVSVGSDGPWVTATRFSCLARLSHAYSFVPTWRPPFVSDVAPEDRCHLNGLAMVDGRPRYITCLGATDTVGGWRERKASGGVLVDVTDGSIRLQGLSMPHSPRWHDGRLWVLDSGRGELVLVDVAKGQRDVVCGLPGYLRGLSLVGPFALIGLCQIREQHIFGGLPVQHSHSKLLCGISVIDLRSGRYIGVLEFTSGCTEVFEVVWLSDVRRPMLLNPNHPAQVDAFTAPQFSYWLRPANRLPDDNPTAGASQMVGNTLRGPATPLPEGFPRIRMYVITYPENAESLAPTLASIRSSDWREEPIVINQPADWPKSRESGSRNYKRALEAAAADGCDFALILQDDVRVNRHLRHNLLTNPLVQRDQCDYLSLFMPDLVADPWERCEPHLGYRLAKPRYFGPNRHWTRARVWGAQGYMLSRRFILSALERWNSLRDGQDARVISVCAEFRLPLWYTTPCLIDHAPLVSAFGTPEAYGIDFDPDYRLETGQGFQPPEAIPGEFTLPEAEHLWRIAARQNVLQLGTGGGRATISLAQSANSVASVDAADQSEASEWVRRYRLAERVTFARDEILNGHPELSGPFGLIVIDMLRDVSTARAYISAVLPLLEPGGVLAFHDYPDPACPGLRKVVDEHSRRLGWKRIHQVDFLGVFRTPC